MIRLTVHTLVSQLYCFPVERETVTCPLHGSKFEIKTGTVLAPPAATGVTSYCVRVSGLDVEVEV